MGLLERLRELLSKKKPAELLEWEEMKRLKKVADEIRESHPESNNDVPWVVTAGLKDNGNRDYAIMPNIENFYTYIQERLVEAGYEFNNSNSDIPKIIDSIYDISKRAGSPIVTDFDIPWVKIQKKSELTGSKIVKGFS